jgi:hypothetical protein
MTSFRIDFDAAVDFADVDARGEHQLSVSVRADEAANGTAE